MKTQEEIEKLTDKWYTEKHQMIPSIIEQKSFIHGYTQCQEDMELAAWDTTLMDGLEEIEWDTKPGFVEKRMALRAQSIKDKAKMLVREYSYINFTTGTNSKMIASYEDCKKCALIAVNEIINTLNSDIRDLDVRGNILLDLIDYWREVKQEIDKL